MRANDMASVIGALLKLIMLRSRLHNNVWEDRYAENLRNVAQNEVFKLSYFKKKEEVIIMTCY